MSRNNAAVDLNRHHQPVGLSDRIAFLFVRFLRFFADTFFAKRYGHRAVVLETVAAVPGMVGGMLNHLKSLRRMQDDRGWIKTLLDEAENERMHLMTFIAVAKPNWLERALVLLVQGVFFNASSCCIFSRRARRTGSSVISRKRLSSATPSIWRRSRPAGMRTRRRRKSPSIIGGWHRMHGCGRW